MSLRARIVLLMGIIATAVVAMAAVVYLTIRGTDYYRERVAFAHRQLAAMTALAGSANYYARQISEVLLLGESEVPDFAAARAAVEANFAELQRVTRAEVAFLEGRPAGEAAVEAQEFAQIDALHGVYREIDRAAEKVFLLNSGARRVEALGLFRAEIENRLSAELQRLLAAAIAGERDEVAVAEGEAAALSRRLTIALAVTAILGLTVSLGAALLLHRTLSGSIGRLMEGAAAIGQGSLQHRIRVTGRDELAVLSRRFNEMAAQIEDQQHRLMLAKSNLESEVQDRTAELQQANARLQHLDRSRVQFLADISHELRTPLTIVRGEAEVSLRGGARPADEYRDTLNRIVQEAAQMSQLVDDLLFIARSESDTIRFEVRPVVLQEVLAEAVVAGEGLTRPCGIRLDRDWPEEPIRIEADPQRLKQAVVILVDNALKYTGDADAVRVTAGRNGGFAEVAVIDRGPGIAGEDLPYVFERFYRGGAGNGDLGGSGLGLPIAKWIAEKLGGAISVTSEPYKRTEFRIRLPLERRA
jgi:signal transduction histidine kinase